MLEIVVVIVREPRNVAIRIRTAWRSRHMAPEPRDLASGERRHQDRSCLLPPDEDTLAVQRALFEAWSQPRIVHVVVIDYLGDVEASVKSLSDQTWGLIDISVSAPDRLADEFRRLSEGHPDDMTVLLRAGDKLRSDALYEVAQAAYRDPLLDLVYWDDDLAEVSGFWKSCAEGQPRGVDDGKTPTKLGDPRVKPGWSPDLLICVNYIGRSFALRGPAPRPRSGSPACKTPVWTMAPFGGICC